MKKREVFLNDKLELLYEIITNYSILIKSICEKNNLELLRSIFISSSKDGFHDGEMILITEKLINFLGNKSMINYEGHIMNLISKIINIYCEVFFMSYENKSLLDSKDKLMSGINIIVYKILATNFNKKIFYKVSFFDYLIKLSHFTYLKMKVGDGDILYHLPYIYQFLIPTFSIYSNDEKEKNRAKNFDLKLTILENYSNSFFSTLINVEPFTKENDFSKLLKSTYTLMSVSNYYHGMDKLTTIDFDFEFNELKRKILNKIDTIYTPDSFRRQILLNQVLPDKIEKLRERFNLIEPQELKITAFYNFAWNKFLFNNLRFLFFNLAAYYYSKRRYDLLSDLITFHNPKDKGYVNWINKRSLLPDNLYELFVLYIFTQNDCKYFYFKEFHDENYNYDAFFVFMLCYYIHLYNRNNTSDNSSVKNIIMNYTHLSTDENTENLKLIHKFKIFFENEVNKIIDRDENSIKELLMKILNYYEYKSILIDFEKIKTSLNEIINQLNTNFQEKISNLPEEEQEKIIQIKNEFIDLAKTNIENYYVSDFDKNQKIFLVNENSKDFNEEEKKNPLKFDYWYLFKNEDLLLNNQFYFLNDLSYVPKIEAYDICRELLSSIIQWTNESADTFKKFLKEEGEKTLLFINFNPYLISQYYEENKDIFNKLLLNIKRFFYDFGRNEMYLIGFKKSDLELKYSKFNIELNPLSKYYEESKGIFRNLLISHRVINYSQIDTSKIIQMSDDELNKNFLIMHFHYELLLNKKGKILAFSHPLPPDIRAELAFNPQKEILDVIKNVFNS